MADRFPAPNGNSDAGPYQDYAKGPLGPNAMGGSIGGTHNVSTKIDPQTALTGGYQPINGDSTPGAGGGGEYLPKN